MLNLNVFVGYIGELSGWIGSNYIEFIAAIISIIGVWLTTKQILWCWPVSLLGLILSLYVFFNTQLYLQATLQIFYIVIAVYGWFNWKRGEKNDIKLIISRLKIKAGLMYLGTGIVLTLIVGYLFRQYTEDPMPWMDSLTTVCGIITTFLMAKKILDNWLIWIFNDIILVGMCYYQKLYIFTILYVVFIILAIYGFIEWRRDLKSPQPTVDSPQN